MGPDEIWAAIDDQRIRLADMLGGLTDEEWRRPSLCDGWTVRDVAVHLTLAQARFHEAFGELVRTGFRMKRAIHLGPIRRPSMTTGDAVDRIRAMVGSRRHIQGVTCRETLIDILVHSQDVAVPLGRDLPTRPPAAAEASTRVWGMGYPFRARRRLAGFRLTATDVDWAAGEGRPVTAPIEAILLLLTGRHAALPRFAGEGAAALDNAVRGRIPRPTVGA